MMHTFRVLVKHLMLAVALTCLTTLMAMAAQASYADPVIIDMSRRITNIESSRLDARLSVLEDNIKALKFWNQAVAVSVIGQFAFHGFSILRKVKM